MSNDIPRDLTYEEAISEIEIGEVGIEGWGIMDGLEAIKRPEHCFGEEYRPGTTCEEECTAVCDFRGKEVKVKDLCRAICAGSRETADRAAKYYRPGSGSYYVVKALVELEEATRPQIAEKAKQLALIDGNGHKVEDEKNRTDRTLYSMYDEDQVHKVGVGDEAIYSLKE